MLVIKDLMKTYPSGVQALKGVSLEIQPGLFGLLGPNGAGKTTLMKILATLLEPDSGTAEMDGLDLIGAKAETRKKLGYLPQDFGLYPTLTAAQMLDYFAKLKRRYRQKGKTFARRGAPRQSQFIGRAKPASWWILRRHATARRNRPGVDR
jgi:ABC-type multidrug transport system ATPase subunit